MLIKLFGARKMVKIEVIFLSNYYKLWRREDGGAIYGMLNRVYKGKYTYNYRNNIFLLD